MTHMKYERIRDQGITWSEERLESGAQIYEDLSPRLEQLRQVQLGFADAPLEPASALQWLEAQDENQG